MRFPADEHRAPFLLPLLLVIAATAPSQSTCPRTVPSSLQLTLPVTLSPGPYPFADDDAHVWVFCDSAPQGGVPLQFTVHGPVSISDYTFNALREPDNTYLWPNLIASVLVKGAAPEEGSQQASIEISAGNGKISLPVRIVSTSRPFIYVVDRSLGFSTSPYNLQDQSVTFWFPNATVPVAFTTSVENADWLFVTPSSGAGYTELKAHVDPSTLSPGSYFGWIVITAADAINSPFKIPVRMLIAQPRFQTFPAALSFTQVSGGAPPALQSLGITAVDTPAGLSFTASSDSSWLAVSPTNGLANLQATLSVSVNAAGLAAGTYHGNISLNAPGAVTKVRYPSLLP